MKRSGPLRRSSGLRSRSDRRDAFEAELDRMRPAVQARAGGRCEARLVGCSLVAAHVHHRKLRSAGGSNRLVNLLAVCAGCHERIHGSPALSFELGLLLRSWADEVPLPGS